MYSSITSERVHLTMREVQPKTWNSSLPFTSRHAGPTQKPRLALCEKANLKAQRGSRPAQNFNTPYKISELKITPAASFTAAIGAGTPLSSGEPDPQPASSRRLKTQGLPLRPIRSKPLCTRAAAQPNPARPGGRLVRSVALDVAARAAAENTHICVICPVEAIHPSRNLPVGTIHPS